MTTPLNTAATPAPRFLWLDQTTGRTIIRWNGGRGAGQCDLDAVPDLLLALEATVQAIETGVHMPNMHSALVNTLEKARS